MRRFTAVRPGVTEHNCPLQLGTPTGWLSPWLPMGASGNTNYWGNLHSQAGSVSTIMGFGALGNPPTSTASDRVDFTASISGTTLTVSAGTAPSIGMAVFWDTWNQNGSTPTDATYYVQSGGPSVFTLSGTPSMAPVTSRAMYGITKYQGATEPTFCRLADPADSSKYAFKVTMTYDDMRPSSQGKTSAGIRKSMPRFGDGGGTPAEGQGILGTRSIPYMDVFSIYVPAATKTQAGWMDDILIWQHKNSTGGPGALISIMHRNFFYPGPQPSTGAGTGNRLVYSANNGGSYLRYVLLDDFPADTWLHFVLRITPGFSAGQNPKNEVWLAVGNAAYSKVLDNTAPNLQADADSVNRQWGWYNGGTDTSYWYQDISHGSPVQCWFSGDKMEIYWKDYTVLSQEIANKNPTAAQLTELFSYMRQR